MVSLDDSNYKPEVAYPTSDYFYLVAHLESLDKKYRVLIELYYFEELIDD